MRQKAIRDHRHMLASGRREGLREGLREGEKIGEERGLQRGLEEGEHKKAVETARKMLSRGRDTVEEIVEITGLPIEEIQKLRE